MAVAYRSSSINAPSIDSNTRTVTEPTGAAQNDILIAVVYMEAGSGTSITPPANWNLINRTSMTDHSGVYYWIRRGASAPSYVWNFGATIYNGVGVVCYSGCETTGDPNNATPVINSGTSATLTCNSITTNVANCMIIGLCTNYTWGLHSSANFTNERLDSGSNNGLAAYDDGLLASAGATGNITVTNAAGSGTFTTAMIALKPPSATSIKTVMGLAKASVKTVNGLAIASVKSINGLT